MPRKIKILNGDINEFFKRGTKVTVQLGYDPELRTEFTGYVARVSAKIPVEIYCEDAMWSLKQNNLTKAFKNVKLKDLVRFIYPGQARVADLQIGSFVIKDQSTAQVLEALKKYTLQAYFDTDGVLVVDFAGSTKQSITEVLYDFNLNIIDNDLEYTRKEDVRIRCKGISKLPTGKKLEFYYGDTDGDLRTLNYVNLLQKDLEKIVKKELDKLKQDGFKNGFTTFGTPYSEPGYSAVLNDTEYPERNGSYLIESVVTSMSAESGFRRKVNLERKLA
ncbi:hypothetical protein ACJVDK_13020 [Pedobacter sp. MW01-1-1]